MTPSPLRVVMLTSPEHHCRYVANRVARHFSMVGLALEGGLAVERPDWLFQARRICRYIRRRVRPRPEERVLEERHRQRSRLRDRLMGPQWRDFDWAHVGQVLRLPRPGINRAEVGEFLAALKPDAVVVFGTTVLGRELLSKIHGVCLNLHTGLTPWYRGTQSSQWALLNRDLAGIGATIHHVVAELDAGPIVLQGRPHLEADDSPESIDVKLYALAGELAVRSLQHLAEQGRLPGVPQDTSLGRCYRRKEFDEAGKLELNRLHESGELAELIRRLPAELAAAPTIIDEIPEETLVC